MRNNHSGASWGQGGAVFCAIKVATAVAAVILRHNQNHEKMKEKENWKERVRTFLGLGPESQESSERPESQEKPEDPEDPEKPEILENRENREETEKPENRENRENQEKPESSDSFDLDEELAKISERAKELFEPSSGIDRERLMDAIEALGETARAVIQGEAGESEVLLMLQAIEANDRIETARREGEIKGRNLAIEELMKPMGQDDGIPIAKGAVANATSPGSIFDLARSAI